MRRGAGLVIERGADPLRRVIGDRRRTDDGEGKSGSTEGLRLAEIHELAPLFEWGLE